MVPHRPRRLGRVLHYAFIMGAGAVAAFFPSLVLKQTVTSYVLYAWVICLALGAAAAFIGTMVDSWLGEYIGCPLVFATIGGFGLISVLSFFTHGFPPAAIVAGLLYLGMALGVYARWAEVNVQRKAARELRKYNPPGESL